MKINNAFLRVLTSLAAISILALVWILFPVKGMFLLVSAITIGLLWEYYKLVFYKISSFWFHLFFLLFGFLSYLLFLLNVFLLPVCFWFVLVFWILHRQEKEDLISGISLSLISLFYICLPTALFLNVFLFELKMPLYQSYHGPDSLFLFLCIIFSGDIFAYLGGSVIGGKKWIPVISPKKTWSGLFCGLFISSLVSGLGFYLTEGFSFLIFFVFGFVSFFIAQTGDLFVSLLKRQAGVKESGFFLPGHGGLLDRLDGFLLALPFMYFCLSFFN